MKNNLSYIFEEDFNFACIAKFEKISQEDRCKVYEIKFSRGTCWTTLIENPEQFYKNMILAVKLFPNVKKMFIINYPNLTDEHFADLGFHVLENLTFIHLINNQHLSGKTFGRIANNCTKLTNFYFTNEICNYFYDIQSEDLVNLLKRNFDLISLGLTSQSLSNFVFNEFSNHENIKTLELSVYGFVDEVDVMNGMLKLLKNVRTFVDINVDKRNIVNYDSNHLRMVNANVNFSSLNNCDDECINLFKSSENDFLYISLSGFSQLTNQTLDAIGSNAHNLQTIKLFNCGKNYTIDGVNLLFCNAIHLKLVLVTSGDLSLGNSGKFYRFGNAILAVLHEGKWFKHSVVKQLKREKTISEENYDEFADLCIGYLSDSSDDDPNIKDETRIVQVAKRKCM
jgi:hypothetical protein